jgi:hypothetical protein
MKIEKNQPSILVVQFAAGGYISRMNMPTWLWALVALASMIIIGIVDFITGYMT